ncbi:hypothetical protein DAEQUDRAFT_722157 [Daedalea quercina L-15889]|uniref:N-acetyltransferase domain-containing protein n=1 Tax=Daedalea quercina L-15889 TaxID=1314783 RepID=A0A165T7W5_9APHY|nr:hypothetical protein DAEQUDRAFT_722157 [Daedalea quercina L-15889]
MANKCRLGSQQQQSILIASSTPCISLQMYSKSNAKGADEDGGLLLSTNGRSFDEAVKVIRFVNVPRAASTKTAAFAHDPLFEYMRNTPDAEESRLIRLLDYLTNFLQFIVRAHVQRALVVDGGYAYVAFGVPGDITSSLERVASAMIRCIRKARTPEQNKRWSETMEKQDAAIQEAIGERIRGMFCVYDLAAHPDRQGRGYGSALMAAANAKADDLGLASWLVSSNINNTAFYESCGFVTVRQFAVGEDNPTWTKPPVVVSIMVREAHGRANEREKAVA